MMEVPKFKRHQSDLTQEARKLVLLVFTQCTSSISYANLLIVATKNIL